VEDKPEIDLNRFRSHKRRIPWVLIRKLVIVSVILGLLYFLKDLIEEKKVVQPKPEGYEVEIVL
jgi:hypothetical protein